MKEPRSAKEILAGADHAVLATASDLMLDVIYFMIKLYAKEHGLDPAAACVALARKATDDKVKMTLMAIVPAMSVSQGN
jgi:hypothetical protein